MNGRRLSVLFVGLLVAFFLSACKRSASKAPSAGGSRATPVKKDYRVDNILLRLRSPDAETRTAAGDDLQRDRERWKGLSSAEGIRLLKAAGEPWPAPEKSFMSTPARLVAVVGDHPHREYIPVVEDIFPRLPLDARQRALDLLSAIDDAEAAKLFVVHLGEIAEEIEPPPPLVRLGQKPHHPEVFFPSLLKLSDHEKLADSIYQTALLFSEKGLLSPSAFAGEVPRLVGAYEKSRAWLLPKQRAKGFAWEWEDDYQDQRERAGLLLDLFGYLPAEAVDTQLEEGTRLRDARLALFATISRLRQGGSVPTEVLDRIASSAECRNWLYRNLEKLQKLELFPSRFRTQEAFAESEMVDWLIYPTELGRVPDQIELVKVVTTDGGPDGLADVYLFKFRTLPPHWAAKNGWMAGIAGPFLRSDAPSPKAYGETFSKFTRWDAMSPAQHVAEIRDLMKTWWEARRKDSHPSD